MKKKKISQRNEQTEISIGKLAIFKRVFIEYTSSTKDGIFPILLAKKKLIKLTEPIAASKVTTLDGIKGRMRKSKIRINDFKLFFN